MPGAPEALMVPHWTVSVGKEADGIGDVSLKWDLLGHPSSSSFRGDLRLRENEALGA